MVARDASFTASRAGGDASSSSVQFGADVGREPVFLSVDVVPSVSFARLMLALGRVVRLRDAGVERDHSVYQAWVQGEYLKELSTENTTRIMQLPALLQEREELTSQLDEHRRLIGSLNQQFNRQRRAFWAWLYNHNRQAWIVLDPIVSVQSDATFFEAFSLDESTYARVTLPHSATVSREEPQRGTTNIDFSVPLERELSRTRSYRPLHLTVGAKSVGLATEVSSIVERKIDLPETWVRGLVEVQAALALAPTTITIDSLVLADILARLEAERERHGPRSLAISLVPGAPVQITVEPWGDVFTASREPFTGSTPLEVKVWGRRRLRVLKDLLPLVPQVTVRLIDSGMPSFWTVELDGIELTIGLSGWTSQDWAGRARFSAIIPASAADDDQAATAARELESREAMSVDDLVQAINIEPGQARLLLQRLCVAGTAMFDPSSGRYRWRALFPDVDLTADTGAGLEERKGVELFRQKAVLVSSDGFEGAERVMATTVQGSEREYKVVLRRDEDDRVTYATCDCSHFRYHKLRQGPCRHIIATSLAGG
jgi:hypothetical protein